MRSLKEYKRKTKAGATASEAALAGLEVTTNFARQGASKAYRVIDTFIPFFSANVQGAYNNIRQMIDYNPQTGAISLKEGAAKKFGRTALIWALPAILQYSLLFMGDDDDREEKLAAFHAETNFVKNQKKYN